MLASVDALREGVSSRNDERPDDHENYSDMPALQSVSDSEDESEERSLHTEPVEEDSDMATETEGLVDVASTGTEDVRTGDEEPDEVQVLDDTAIVLEPVDSSGKGSEGSRPSNAFTTDGRGRVISFGDIIMGSDPTP